MKPELGYYLVFSNDEETINAKVPIYGIRAIPDEIAERHPDKNFKKENWQVEAFNCLREYMWINMPRAFIFFH